MIKPLLCEECNALEYNFLIKDYNGMNIYSAKIDEDYYILVDDYDIAIENIQSEKPIVHLDGNKFLCVANGKYGIVDIEGWEIIPFIFDWFEKRNEDSRICYNVEIDNRWGVIDSHGKEIFRIKYKKKIPELKQDSIELVESADTNRFGLVNFEGEEIIPTIYTSIIACENPQYIYITIGGDENRPQKVLMNGCEVERSVVGNGLTGCFDLLHKKEIIQPKFHSIHMVDNWFIAGDDFYIDRDDFYHPQYYGEYYLYDTNGTKIIGKFNHCEIKKDFFILDFGITIETKWASSLCETCYGPADLGYYYNTLNFDNACAIIVDKNLKSLVPRHLLKESLEEIKFEYDFLWNNLPTGKGLLVGESPTLRKGQEYDKDSQIIKSINVAYASFLDNNTIIYSPIELYAQIHINPYTEEEKCLRGIIYCREDIILKPLYLAAKSLNEELILVEGGNKLVGIRDSNKELITPKFNLITNSYNGFAIGFTIKASNAQENIEDEITNIEYECSLVLLTITEHKVSEKEFMKLTGSELYSLLYNRNSVTSEYCFVKGRDNYKSVFSRLNENDRAFIEGLWEKFPKDYNREVFWFPYYRKFDFLWDDENQDPTATNYFSSDDNNDYYNWGYYNDGLDMDQQDECFYNF